MKKLLIGLLVLIAISISTVIAKSRGEVTFNPSSVHIGETYTILVTNLQQGEVRITAYYGEESPGTFQACTTIADQIGTASCQFVVTDTGRDDIVKTNYGRLVLTKGFITHAVFQLRPNGCKGPSWNSLCYEMVSSGSLPVN